jgi:hypothetical protein
MLFVVRPSRRFVETLFALVAEQLWKEGDDPQDLSAVSLSGNKCQALPISALRPSILI